MNAVVNELKVTIDDDALLGLLGSALFGSADALDPSVYEVAGITLKNPDVAGERAVVVAVLPKP